MTWRDLYQYNISVSNTGNVRSIKSGRVLKTYRRKDYGGYILITRWVNGKHRTFRVHRLVAIAFHGEPKQGQEVLHINGIPTDNRACNLRWGTRTENCADAKRHKTAAIGSRNGQSKLNEGTAGIIKRLIAGGLRNCEISRMLKIHKNRVSEIRNNICWRHV